MPVTRILRAAHLVWLLSCLSVPAFAADEEPLQVLVAPVREVLLSDPIEALGTLRANESANLTSTATDTISEIRFDDGQRVSKGDVLVVLSNREQVADRAEATAALEEARQQYERVQDLARRGTASASLLDQRRRELETARAQVGAADARLGNRRIVAPFDGVVGLRNVSVGSLMTPGTEVTTIHDDSVMKLDFTVPELYLAVVAPGLQVEATSRAFPEEQFRGEVVSVGNEVDPVTRAFRVRAMIPNPERKLRSGMLMTLRLSSRERETLIIPEEALVTRGRDHAVFVVADDASAASVAAQRRAVRIGVRRPGEVEIVDGLRAGEHVVIHGAFRIADGDDVLVRAVVGHEQALPEILSNRDDG